MNQKSKAIASAIEHINTNTLTGIKAGTERENFLNIWMVVVDNRIFARSWGLAEKSWYNSFLKEPAGKIKCGELEFKVIAKIPEDLEHISDRISEAYLRKYNSGANIPYAQGIIRPEHVEKTMELEITGK